MAQITKLYNYVNGQDSNAEHVTAEFQQLIDESNAQDLRHEKIKLDSADTVPGFLLTKVIPGANITLTEVVESGTRKTRIAAASNVSYDHGLMANRDLADQHPASAITGLDDFITGLNKVEYDAVNKVLILSVPGCEAVQLCPIVFGTGANPPAGTYPKGTLYVQHEA